MSGYVKISVTIPIDSDIYRKSMEIVNKNKDLDFIIFSSPENFLEACLELGSNPHIMRNMEILASKADKYRKNSLKKLN